MYQLIGFIAYMVLGVYVTRWAFNHPVWDPDDEDANGWFILSVAWLMWPAFAVTTLILIGVVAHGESEGPGKVTRLLRKLLVR